MPAARCITNRVGLGLPTALEPLMLFGVCVSDLKVMLPFVCLVYSKRFIIQPFVSWGNDCPYQSRSLCGKLCRAGSLASVRSDPRFCLVIIRKGAARKNVPQLRAPVFAFSTIRESITTPPFHVFSDPTGCLSVHRNHVRSVMVSPPLSDGRQFEHRPNRPSPQRFLISSGKSTNY